MHSTSIQLQLNKFQNGFKGIANSFDIALQQNPMDVEAVCSGLNLPRRVNSHVRMCSCNMSLKHVPAAFSCVRDCCDFVPATFPRYMSLLHVPATCPCYTSPGVYSTQFCRCYMSPRVRDPQRGSVMGFITIFGHN